MRHLYNKFISRLGFTVRAEAFREWKDIEYFDKTWKNRIRLMASFLPEKVSVLDLGCGEMWLKGIGEFSEYIPVDYCDRGPGTQVCDFNNGEFPAAKADYAFVSGCLEYVKDADWFVRKISEACDACVISYCTTDYTPSIDVRNERCWVNSFSRGDIIRLFQTVDMCLVQETIHEPGNNIFMFKKSDVL